MYCIMKISLLYLLQIVRLHVLLVMVSAIFGGRWEFKWSPVEESDD